MGKLALSTRTKRVLHFMMGARESEIVEALEPFGFSEADLDEAWSLLSTVAGQALVGTPEVPDLEPKIIAQLDEFENIWFPVTKSTLERHFPEIASALFVNLVQTQGREVAVSVATFLERVSRMAEGQAPFGVEGPRARELLVRRGLTEDLATKTVALLKQLRTFKGTAVGTTVSEEERQASEDELWAWYKEWSAVARAGIKNRSHLRRLGFLKSQGGVEVEVVSETPSVEESAEESPLLPAPMAGGGDDGSQAAE